MERVKGIEPSTRSLGSYCSTTELHPHFDAQSDLVRPIVQAPYRFWRERGLLEPKGLGAPWPVWGVCAATATLMG
jgi:hypothetical protein